MKTSINQFAIFGGKPAFKEKLHVGRPNIGNKQRVLELIGGTLDNYWLTNNGRLVQEFEQKLAEHLSVRHCVAVCNGTIGLEIASQVLGLKGEVIIPSFTFVATAHALLWKNITPVFCDIDPESHNIDPSRIEALITPQTSGILGVHCWGRPCDIDALSDLSSKHKLALIFDAAHAMSCSHNGKTIGGFGALEVFSFHANKVFNTFEGGAITTNDDKLAEKIRLLRNFGFAGIDKVVSIGINGKMTEASAAMGLVSLDYVGEFINRNRQNYQVYQESLFGLPGLDLVTYNENENNNYHYVVLVIDESLAGVSRDLLVETLWAENVLARRYFYPGVHRMEPYYSMQQPKSQNLPHTEQLVKKVLSLPNGSAVSQADVKLISKIIRIAIEESDRFKELWAENQIKS